MLFVSVKNWLTLRPLRLIILSVKALSEDPYLKSFISRVRTKHRARFRSLRRYAIRHRVESYFLVALHRAVSTKAVNVMTFNYRIIAIQRLFVCLVLFFTAWVFCC